MLYTHPTIIVFISAILLLLFRNYSKIFNWTAVFYPLINIFLLGNSNNRYDSFSVFNLTFISNITYEIAIAIAFLFIVSLTNIVAINNNKKWEVIIGAFANFAAFICLFAGDFISIFIGIELLMITSTILIFMGYTPASIKATNQYFLTHLFSSGLILIGVSYIIATKGSTEIIPLTDLINNKDQGFVFYILLMTGCLINVAAVFFTGWFVNCYPEASSSGFIYLTLFSTKVSIVILIKLFTGLAALKLIGIMMMIYGSIYACLEENLRKLICYLIISQLGLMVVAISIGIEVAIDYAITYIPVHIFYITLFIYLITLLESINIKTCGQIKKIKNFMFTVSLFIAVLMISNFPLTAGFITKLVILQNSLDNFTYYLTLFLNCLISAALPFKEYLFKEDKLTVSMRGHDKSTLFWLIIAILIYNFNLLKAFIFSTDHSIAFIINAITDPVLKQLMVIIASIIIACIIKIPRFSTSNIDFDLYQITERFIFFYTNRIKGIANNKQEEEYLNFKAIWSSILKKISIWHNGQTSILIVILLLVGFILMLNFA